MTCGSSDLLPCLLITPCRISKNSLFDQPYCSCSCLSASNAARMWLCFSKILFARGLVDYIISSFSSGAWTSYIFIFLSLNIYGYVACPAIRNCSKECCLSFPKIFAFTDSSIGRFLYLLISFAGIATSFSSGVNTVFFTFGMIISGSFFSSTTV